MGIGNEYAVTFLFTPARSGPSFDAWYEHDPQNRFVLTPTIEMLSDGNTASGFDMTFTSDSKLGNFVAHYMRTNEADPNSETPKALKTAKKLVNTKTQSSMKLARKLKNALMNLELRYSTQSC